MHIDTHTHMYIFVFIQCRVYMAWIERPRNQLTYLDNSWLSENRRDTGIDSDCRKKHLYAYIYIKIGLDVGSYLALYVYGYIALSFTSMFENTDHNNNAIYTYTYI